MSKRIVGICERALSTTVNNIQHIESQSYNGVGVIKIYFQPSVQIDLAIAQVTALAQSVLRQMPPDILPPQILKYDTSSVPIVQLSLGGQGLSQETLYDLGQNFIRPQLANVEVASIPSPYLCGILLIAIFQTYMTGKPARAALCVVIIGLLVMSLVPRSFPENVYTFLVVLLTGFMVGIARRVNAFSYNSTVLTGTLRDGMTSLYKALNPIKRDENIEEAHALWLVIASFLVGATAGGLLGKHVAITPFGFQSSPY